MGTKFPVLDADTDLFENEDTSSLGTGDLDSSAVATDGFKTSDRVCDMGIAIHWPGITSGGAATIQLEICSDDTTTPTDAIVTTKVFTLAEAVAAFGTGEGYIIPVPNAELADYLRLRVVVAVAALTGGTLTAGLVPMPA